MSENEKRQHLRALEIFTNSNCGRNCPKCNKKPVRDLYPDFEFTPEMATRLVEKLHEYRCDIHEIVFAGGEPLLWTYLEECVGILRQSGRVQKMIVATALVEGMSMAPYESLFDLIRVSDYVSNRHLIERHTGKKNYEFIDKQNHRFQPRGRIPGTIPGHCFCQNSWLLGDCVYFCPLAGPLLKSTVELNMTREERDSYRWSIDEFLQNLKQCRDGFGNRPICEACSVNSNVRAITGESPVAQEDVYGPAVYGIRRAETRANESFVLRPRVRQDALIQEQPRLLNKPRIKVLQYMYGSKEYFAWSEKINRAYCLCHGYDYRVSNATPREDRNVVWQKLEVILSEFHSCDYMLFLDADAYFYSHELSIEDILIPLMGEKSMLMASDVSSEKRRWQPEKPNSGVILAKRDDSAKMFFEYWNEIPNTEASVRWKWPPTQRGLWRFVIPKFPDTIRTHEEYYLIQGQFGSFIRHLVAMHDECRVEQMQQFCQRHGIS